MTFSRDMGQMVQLKKLSSSSNLKRHIRNQHDLAFPAFSYDKCGKTFAKANTVKNHKCVNFPFRSKKKQKISKKYQPVLLENSNNEIKEELKTNIAECIEMTEKVIPHVKNVGGNKKSTDEIEA